MRASSSMPNRRLKKIRPSIWPSAAALTTLVGTIRRNISASAPAPATPTGIDSDAEQWEGVLVRFAGPCSVNLVRADYGVVETSCFLLDDDMWDYSLSQGQQFDHMTGVIHFGFDEYRLLPRGPEDLGLSGGVDAGSGHSHLQEHPLCVEHLEGARGAGSIAGDGRAQLASHAVVDADLLHLPPTGLAKLSAVEDVPDAIPAAVPFGKDDAVIRLAVVHVPRQQALEDRQGALVAARRRRDALDGTQLA